MHRPDLHKEFQGKLSLLGIEQNADISQPVLNAVAATRSTLQAILRDLGEKLLTVAVAGFLLYLLVLCAGGAYLEQLHEKFGAEEED